MKYQQVTTFLISQHNYIEYDKSNSFLGLIAKLQETTTNQISFWDLQPSYRRLLHILSLVKQDDN